MRAKVQRDCSCLASGHHRITSRCRKRARTGLRKPKFHTPVRLRRVPRHLVEANIRIAALCDSPLTSFPAVERGNPIVTRSLECAGDRRNFIQFRASRNRSRVLTVARASKTDGGARSMPRIFDRARAVEKRRPVIALTGLSFEARIAGHDAIISDGLRTLAIWMRQSGRIALGSLALGCVVASRRT